ncbi:MAG TPA: hypothetical protein DHD79_10155 [Firmicutes bacterium]|nr:hypothetical protein [Bacillota bacterium]HAW71425.1 hypothetical protein [Bacillota bacterium]HBE05183.1 hypothetical protein [Bacillota bacterium]HBG43934.1 hypothetical protein [Bacillota bacterium]HBL51019.1 hypothetical protein [Bacillota bacterium]
MADGSLMLRYSLLLLLMLVIAARPAAAAPRINAIFGGSVLETVNTGMSALWNPALSAYNEDTMVSVSVMIMETA